MGRGWYLLFIFLLACGVSCENRPCLTSRDCTGTFNNTRMIPASTGSTFYQSPMVDATQIDNPYWARYCDHRADPVAKSYEGQLNVAAGTTVATQRISSGVCVAGCTDDADCPFGDPTWWDPAFPNRASSYVPLVNTSSNLLPVDLMFQRRFCDFGTHRCVQCRRSEDCTTQLFGSRNYCNDKGECELGCVSSLTCVQVLTWDATTLLLGTMVQNGVCDTSTHKCVDCLHDDDCVITHPTDYSRRYCSKDHICVEGCNDNQDCLINALAQGNTTVAITNTSSAFNSGGYTIGPPAVLGYGNNTLYKPFCEGSTHRCVECRTSADCDSAKYTITRGNHWCVAGICVPGCDDNTDCIRIWSSTTVQVNNGIPVISPQICDYISHQCVVCIYDSDCANYAFPTTTSQLSFVCNGQNQCVLGCNDEADCDPSNGTSLTATHCDFMTGQCVECRSGYDCAQAGYYCSVDNHCVPGCDSVSDCQVTVATDGLRYCNYYTHSCIECIYDTHCSTGADKTRSVCSGDGRCIEGCILDSDCPAGNLLTICSDLKQCVQCTLDIHCTNGDHCVENRCVYGCRLDSHCTGGLVCSTTLQQCVPCQTDWHCSAGTGRCIGASGDRPRCAGCIVNADCRNAALPVCYQNECVACLNHGDCNRTSAALVCDLATHTCVPGCESDVDCNKTLTAALAPTPATLANDPEFQYYRFCHPENHVCTQCRSHGDCNLLPPTGLSVGRNFCNKDYLCTFGCTQDSDCVASPLSAQNLTRCDLTQNKCVMCLSHRDCKASTNPIMDPRKPFCNEQKICMSGCTYDSDCAGGIASSPFNSFATHCSEHSSTCVECNTHAHCQTANGGPGAPFLFCGTEGKCVVGCVTDVDCRYKAVVTSDTPGSPRDRPFCSRNHQCVQCLHSDDCQFADANTTLRFCSANNVCIRGCNDDIDCNATLAPLQGYNNREKRCDGSNHECVQCLHHSDCDTFGEYQWCNEHHVCVVGCETSADCNSTGPLPRCDSGNHVCVQCNEHQDCQTSIFRWCSAEHICVEGCDSDIDCNATARSQGVMSAGDYCDYGSHTCIQCKSHDYCPTGEICNSKGLCEPGCADDTDCTLVGGVCDVGNLVCVPCLHSDDCKRNSSITGFAEFPYCWNKKCVSGCSSDLDCTPIASGSNDKVDQKTGSSNQDFALFCHPGLHHCVECITHINCWNSNTRVGSSLRQAGKPFCDFNNFCVPGCDEDADCPLGANPQDPSNSSSVAVLRKRCDVSTHECVECIGQNGFNPTGGSVPEHPDCTNPARPVCDGASQTCVGSGRCYMDGDCPRNWRCFQAECVECLFSSDCDAAFNTSVASASPKGSRRYCNHLHVCEDGCTQDSDCRTVSNIGSLIGEGVGSSTDFKNDIYCDVSNHQCVQCRTNEHCVESIYGLNNYCNENHQCVFGCGRDADCLTTRAREFFHGNASYCSHDHKCVQCVDNADCPSTTYCWDYNCLPGCTTSGRDCLSGSNRHCNAALHKCVQCLHHHHCQGGDNPFCSQDGICVKGCNDDSDCPAGSHPGRERFEFARLCDGSDHSCVECLHSDDCAVAPNLWCNHLRFCEPGCNSHSDCPAGFPAQPNIKAVWCEAGNHACVECLHDDHCDKGWCDDTFTCVAGCNTDSDCSGSTPRCDAGSHKCVQCHHSKDCVTAPNLFCGAGWVCVSGCLTNSDCAAGGQVCDASNHRCVDCLSNEQCKNGTICKLATRTCVAGMCDVNSDCTGRAGTPWCQRGNQACVECLHSDHCTAKPNTYCSKDWKCVSGCTTDSNCAGTMKGLLTVPYCDGGNHVCVQCMHDEHCSGATPVCSKDHVCVTGCSRNSDCFFGEPSLNSVATMCNVGNRKCVQCLQHDHCTQVPNNWCNSQGFCVQGCNDAGDCASLAPYLWCNDATHSCQIGCNRKEDCPAGFGATNNTGLGPFDAQVEIHHSDFCLNHQCVQCLHDDDCNWDKKLRICGANHFCTLGCNDDTDCVGFTSASHHFCDSRTKTCRAGCTNDTHCASGMLCVVESNKCVECLVSHHCKNKGSAQYCNWNLKCVDGCEDNNDCLVGTNGTLPYCDPGSHTCHDCVHHGDCLDGRVGYFNKPVCSKDKKCVAGCNSQSDCLNNLFCDPSNRVCVECYAREHCLSPGHAGPVCDTTTNTCIQGCFFSEDCTGVPGRPVCSQRNLTCVQCQYSSNCSGSTPVCNITTNMCVSGCEMNSHCPNQVCHLGTHTCVECLDPSDCLGKTNINGERLAWCNVTSNQCEVGCYVNSDCPGKRCLVSTHTCVECTADAHCNGVHRVCSKSHTCTIGCDSHSDCSGATPSCVNGACVPCTHNSQCSGASAICDARTGTCSVGCRNNSDCAAVVGRVPHCVSGACLQCLNDNDCEGRFGICNTQNLCDLGCNADADCSGRTPKCVRRQCVSCVPGVGDCPPPSEVCLHDWECNAPGKPACDVARLSCVECTLDEHCGTSRPACNVNLQKCVQCTQNSHCTVGICDVSTQTCSACFDNNDCPSGSVCHLTNGIASCVECVLNSDCPSTKPTCTPEHVCVACLSGSGDCIGKGVCSAEHGNVCVPCVSDSECTTFYRVKSKCDAATGICWTEDDEEPVWTAFDNTTIRADGVIHRNMGYHIATIVIGSVALLVSIFACAAVLGALALGFDPESATNRTARQATKNADM